MIETKKNSNLQTRTRVGLDAYCRKLAKRYGIIDGENSSGIRWVEGTQSNFDIDDDIVLRRDESLRRLPIATDNHFIASVLASMKGDTNIETRPFVPSDTEYFWECYRCRSLPFDYRAKGSVVHSVGEPERKKIEDHIKNCTGEIPLAIPRSAIIEPYYGEGVPTIKIKWESTASSTRSLNVNAVEASVLDGRLCVNDDQQYMTRSTNVAS